jgi:hypothetical protein
MAKSVMSLSASEATQKGNMEPLAFASWMMSGWKMFYACVKVDVNRGNTLARRKRMRWGL